MQTVKRLSPEEFADRIRAEEQRRALYRSEIVEFVKTAPVPDEVVHAICWLPMSDRDLILREHPGFDADRKIRALWSMLKIFEQAHADLSLQLQRFNEFSKSRDLHRPSGRAMLAEIEASVNKEVLAVSAAAAVLVQYSRRVKGEVPIAEFDAMRVAHFDEREHAFMTELRNVIGHQEFPDIQWQITWAKERTATFVMSTEGLVGNSSLNVLAKAFVARCDASIDIGTLVDAYASRVKKFYDWYRVAISINEPLALSDYRRIERAALQVSARNSYRMVLSEVLKKKLDPYQYLDRYLDADQIAEVLKLPNHSQSQADLIISLADTYGACDDELRALIYRLFQVAGRADEPLVGPWKVSS